ncbi:MAG: AAA family ATPase [Streptococcaceae bacterium]|jgi:chromosome partitioning protein|nr:AAA family ATPase [Streptococcaceae bacterium]
MKITCFCNLKGGVGKSTLAYNFSEWLAANGRKVLLIDFDHQCSLSQTYGMFTNDATAYNIFSSNEIVQIRPIHENLDFISGSPLLDQLENELVNRMNKELLFLIWLQDNREMIETYDHIIIDCHPDFLTVTKNAILVSDFVICPIEPSKYGYLSKELFLNRFEVFQAEAVDVRTRETFVTAKPLFIGNRIRHNTKSSREFSEAIEKDNQVITCIPEKELFNRSTLDSVPIVQMMTDDNYQSENKFFIQLNNIFNQLISLIE